MIVCDVCGKPASKPGSNSRPSLRFEIVLFIDGKDNDPKAHGAIKDVCDKCVEHVVYRMNQAWNEASNPPRAG